MILHSPNILLSRFSTSDCYESFSDPKEYFELFHNHKRGPFFLSVISDLEIFSYIYGFISKILSSNTQYRRINGTCSSSLIFSNQVIPITEINIEIKIKQYNNDTVLANVVYKFQGDFEYGVYILRDMRLNFGIKVKILKKGTEYVSRNNNLTTESFNFLSSISDYEGDICVITENNKDIVIRPTYLNIRSKGVLTGIRANRIINNQIDDFIEFPAFGCISADKNPNQNFVFIEDDLEDLHSNFTAIFYKFDSDEVKIEEISFMMQNIMIKDFSQHKNVPYHLKKIFLLGEWTVISCQDNHEHIVFKTDGGTIYHTLEVVGVEILPNVTEYRLLSIPGTLPCFY